ncbi:hypothetical protein [Nocardia carnea]|uniref:Uncharacterized protein n=1 Tax=Nocardia carnea TaxID=37328 RepID=A0ABW7TZP3_9NOCA|nr:hypothetical protein [Nocardia carnea]
MSAENGDRVLLIRDVVRDVIADIAPDELPFVDRLRQLDDERVVRLLSRRRRGRDLLGFGLDEMVVLASPVVWIVVNEAAQRFTNSAITGGGKAARFGLRRLLGRTEAASAVPEMTRDQIAEVRARVLQSATDSGMDEERARLVADAVAGRLALGAAPDPDHTPEDGRSSAAGSEAGPDSDAGVPH